MQQWARATQRKDDKVADCHGHANFLRTQSVPRACHCRVLKIGEPRVIHADVLRQSQIDDSEGIGEVEKELIGETSTWLIDQGGGSHRKGSFPCSALPCATQCSPMPPLAPRRATQSCDLLDWRRRGEATWGKVTLCMGVVARSFCSSIGR
jgi:hypothetical protein